MRRLLVLGAVAIMLAACATNYSHDGFIGEVLAQGITPRHAPMMFATS
jgi:hypothetical protein